MVNACFISSPSHCFRFRVSSNHLLVLWFCCETPVMLRAANARSAFHRISSSSTANCCHQKHGTKFQTRPVVGSIQNISDGFFGQRKFQTRPVVLGNIQNILDGFFGQRKFSVSNDPIPQGLVDQTFSSTYSSLDGKVYTYATVIVKSMRHGDSVSSTGDSVAESAWSHACSLTAPNLPSCAVAFVSKPTVAAAETIKKIAHCMHNANTAEMFSRVCNAEAQNAKGWKNSEDCRVLDEAVLMSGGFASHPSMAPIIGCVAEGLAGDGRNNRGGRNCGGEGKSTKISRSKLAANDSLDMQYGSFIDQERRKGEVCAEGLLMPADDSRCYSKDSIIEEKEEEDGEDKDDVGSLSDWEHMLSEYDEWKAKQCGLDSAHDSADSDEGSLPDVSISEIGKYDRIKRYREKFIMFKGLLNPTKTRKSDDHESELENQKLMARDLEEKIYAQKKTLKLGNLLGWNKRENWIAQQVEHFPKAIRQKKKTHVEDVSDREREACTLPEAGSRENESGVQSKKSEEIVGDEEGQYELILCVAHLPGARVVPFHSSTTGIPNLPDLEIAVTTNNPHMLLLAAPGFPFSEFIQRLSTVFPVSARAGAFMAPLYTDRKNNSTKMSGQGSANIFVGTKEATLGVVGLSISSEGLGVKVPIEAFAEFIRLSLGVAQIDGHTFLDDDVSKSLFRPRNVILEHSMFLQRMSSVDPMLVLQQLDSFLMRHGNTSSGITIPSSLVRNAKTEKVSKISETRENVGVCVKKIEKASTERSKIHESLYSMVSTTHDDDKFRQQEVLPLALFDAVLFPGWSMPFYIYEPCYKFMVKHCLEQGKPFGLSTVWHPDPIDCEDIVGTIANLKVYMFEKNYSSFIVAHGVRRFRVSSERTCAQLGSFGLNMGEIHYFDDIEFGSLTEKEEVTKLAKRVVNLCHKVIPEANLAPRILCLGDPTVASFAIGHILPVPIGVKRRWLSMVNTKDRLLEQLTFLNSS